MFSSLIFIGLQVDFKQAHVAVDGVITRPVAPVSKADVLSVLIKTDANGFYPLTFHVLSCILRFLYNPPKSKN